MNKNRIAGVLTNFWEFGTLAKETEKNIEFIDKNKSLKQFSLIIVVIIEK